MEDKKRDPIAKILLGFHFFYILACVVVLGVIVYIQCAYRLEPKYERLFKPNSAKILLRPERGSILAKDGRLLAMSSPMYQVEMDPSVRKAEFAHKPDSEKMWLQDARKLSAGLAKIYRDKSADQYYNAIVQARKNNRKYLKIGYLIDYKTLQEVKRLPLFRRGRFKGGFLPKTIDTRQYPYGNLARRTIGYVKNNYGDCNNAIGLEGKFNYALHGKEGYEWMRLSDNRQRIHNYDSSWVKPKNGYDIRTTIDIDIQDIADRALREQIMTSKKVQGGCAIVMDVRTGGIRAMVNLLRDSSSNLLYEGLNMAIGRSGEPGSVFKTASLMSLLEDGKIESLDEEIPTNHGRLKYFKPDWHVVDYEKKTQKNTMSILHGFEISSNYMFRKLIIDNYGSNPQKFIDQLYSFKLGADFEFDIEGLRSPYIPTPNKGNWSATDLGQMAIGYNVELTPLHTITFYNAIANKGTMQKPYLVESIENNGKVVKEFGPKLLNGRICSKATADTLTRALKSVTRDGTAKWALINSACEVAGKTGTSRIAQGSGGYIDSKGRIQYQATFVGYFPADAPKYTTIVVMYSYPGSGLLYGGTLPAKAFRTIVDKLYVLDPANGETVSKKGPMPKLNKREN